MIVVIGLIIGAVVAGSSVVKQAKLQSIITDLNTYKSAVYTFRLEFNALPGDITNATSYWGGTGNGNGNREIGTDAESWRAWQHLALSKIIQGTYTGLTGSSSDYTPGENIPESSISGTGYQLKHHNVSTSHSWEVAYYRKSGLAINVASSRNGSLEGPSFSAPESYNIDIKIDDGVPDSGILFVGKGHLLGAPVSGCVDRTWNITPPVSYNTMNDNNDIACILLYWLQ